MIGETPSDTRKNKTSNSFIIPTHQVNAYIMGPGNYKTSDFFRFGSILSILFLLVTTIIVYVFYV